MTTPNFHDEPELLNSRKLTAEEEFFYKTAFKEPVKNISVPGQKNTMRRAI